MLAELSQIQRYGHGLLPLIAAGPDARQRLDGIAGPSPRAFCFGAFECRLDTIRGNVDFAACLQGGEAKSALRAGEDWPRTWHRTVLQRWVDPSSKLFSVVSDVWLEFDLDTADPPQPFLHFAPIPLAGRDALPAVRAILEEGIGVDEIGPNAVEHAVRSREHLITCVDKLPATAAVMLIASLGHRQAHRLRMSVALVADEIPDYLATIGWPGCVRSCQRLLEEMGATAWKSVPLQIDVMPSGVVSRISFEFVALTSVGSDPRWKRVLDYLVARQICLPEWLPHLEQWSEGVSPAALASDSVIQLGRQLNVKVSLDPGQQSRAKAYLGFWPRIVLLH